MPGSTSYILRSVRFQTNNGTAQTAVTRPTQAGNVYHVRAIICATDGSTSASYERVATFEHSAAGTVTQVGSTTSVHTAEDIAAPMDVALSADDTNKQFIVTVTGDPGRTINWTIYLETFFSKN